MWLIGFVGGARYIRDSNLFSVLFFNNLINSEKFILVQAIIGCNKSSGESNLQLVITWRSGLVGLKRVNYFVYIVTLMCCDPLIPRYKSEYLVYCVA